jgi:hypothetical protein
MTTTLLAFVKGVHLLTTTFLQFFAILSTFDNVRFFFGQNVSAFGNDIWGDCQGSSLISGPFSVSEKSVIGLDTTSLVTDSELMQEHRCARYCA